MNTSAFQKQLIFLRILIFIGTPMKVISTMLFVTLAQGETLLSSTECYLAYVQVWYTAAQNPSVNTKENGCLENTFIFMLYKSLISYRYSHHMKDDPRGSSFLFVPRNTEIERDNIDCFTRIWYNAGVNNYIQEVLLWNPQRS